MGVWEWTDKTTVDYTNWGQGFPNSQFFNCAMMFIGDFDEDYGHWGNNVNCTNTRRFNIHNSHSNTDFLKKMNKIIFKKLRS